MRYVPKIEELESTVKLVNIIVKGEYFISEDRMLKVRPFSVNIDVRENYNQSDVERALIRFFKNNPDYPGFRSLRQNEVDKTIEPKKTDKKIKLKELYSEMEINEIKNYWIALEKHEREEKRRSEPRHIDIEYQA